MSSKITGFTHDYISMREMYRQTRDEYRRMAADLQRQIAAMERNPINENQLSYLEDRLLDIKISVHFHEAVIDICGCYFGFALNEAAEEEGKLFPNPCILCV